MTDHLAVYNEAELLAIQIVREAAAEWSAGPDYSLSELINSHLLEFQGKHGTDSTIADLVVVALSRFAVAALASARGSWGAIPAFLDEFEMHKLKQHQDEKDNPHDPA